MIVKELSKTLLQKSAQAIERKEVHICLRGGRGTKCGKVCVNFEDESS